MSTSTNEPDHQQKRNARSKLCLKLDAQETPKEMLIFGYLRNCDNTHSNTALKCITDWCILFLHISIASDKRQVSNDDECTVFSPFSLLFAMYDASVASRFRGWNACPVSHQCRYLDHNKITMATVTDLLEIEYDVQHLSPSLKASLTLELRHIFTLYAEDSLRARVSLARSQYEKPSPIPLSQWSTHDVVVSLVNFIITILNCKQRGAHLNSSSDVWKFVHYVRRYLIEFCWNGHVLSQNLKYETNEHDYGMHKFMQHAYDQPAMTEKVGLIYRAWLRLFGIPHAASSDSETNAVDILYSTLSTGQQFIYHDDYEEKESKQGKMHKKRLHESKGFLRNQLLIGGFTSQQRSIPWFIPGDVQNCIQQFYGKTYYVYGESPSDTRFDYSVEFLVPMKRIGIMLNSAETRITKCQSEFAQKNIIANSEIVQINDNYVYGKQLTTEENDDLWENMKENGASYVIFRASKRYQQIGTHFLFDVMYARDEPTSTTLFPYHLFVPQKLNELLRELYGDERLGSVEIIAVYARKQCMSGSGVDGQSQLKKGVTINAFIQKDVECTPYHMNKLNYLLQTKLGGAKDLDIKLSHSMKGLRGYGIESKIPPSVWENKMKKLNSLIYLVKGVDDGRNAWYYIMVDFNQLERFLQALDHDIIHLEQFGTILQSAYGSEPPELVTEKLKQKWMIEED